MGFVDLHVHSNASDGTLAPKEVVSLAVSRGLEAIALTDHDTTEGLAEALSAAKGLPIEIIPGIELSCLYHGEEIHILGLYTDSEDQRFKEETDALLAVRNRRNEEMIRRFQDGGIPITRSLLEAGNPDTVITRAHFARALVELGAAASLSQAFKNYLQYGGPYCPHKDEIEPERAMKILTDCGAFPVLAHPFQYKLGDQKTEELIADLKDQGLLGLEVYHSSNNQYESGKLQKMAKKFGLMPTGGSDFHGANKPDIEIGTGRGNLRVSSLLLQDIKKYRMQQAGRLTHREQEPGKTVSSN